MQLNLQGKSSWHKNKNRENKIWKRNLHCFFCFKTENSSNIVQDVLKSVADQVVIKERNEPKLPRDYEMTAEKLQLLAKRQGFPILGLKC